jgi:hypothetical protein
MKNRLKILTVLAIGIFLLPTCKKDPDLRMPDLQTNGVIPLVEKDATKDQSISFLNLAGFNATVTVDLYYKDIKPQSMNLMVCMNGEVAKTGTVLANITSFPVSVNVTTTNLVDWIPGLDAIDSIKLGDRFKFYTDVTLVDGTVVNGNDPLYTAYNSNIDNLPGSSVDVTYTVLCPLDMSMAIGDYVAYSPPSDWNSTGDVVITQDGVDPYTVYLSGLAAIDGESEDLGPLVMHIDPVTYAVTADKTVIDSDFYGYTNYAFEGSGTYNTCSGTYTMKFEISSDAGSWGEFNYTLTRK